MPAQHFVSSLVFVGSFALVVTAGGLDRIPKTPKPLFDELNLEIKKY